MRPAAGQTMTLESHALDHPDVWFEEIVGTPTKANFYISDALERDLQRAGVIHAWRVTEARIR